MMMKILSVPINDYDDVHIIVATFAVTDDDENINCADSCLLITDYAAADDDDDGNDVSVSCLLLLLLMMIIMIKIWILLILQNTMTII